MPIDGNVALSIQLTPFRLRRAHAATTGCTTSTVNFEDYLKVNDIYKEANASESTRRLYSKRLRSRGVWTEWDREPRVPFKDGCFLYEALGLDPWPLLLGASMDPSILGGNYLLLEYALPPEYGVLWWGDTSVLYLPATQKVNATQLFQVLGMPRRWLSNYLQKNRHIHREVQKGGPGKPGSKRGSYLALNDAYELCTEKELDTKLIQAISAECSLSYT